MSRTLLSGIVVALAVTTLGGTRATMQTKSPADVYADKCVVCHGADGAGKTARGRKLKVKDVRETTAKMTAAQMIEVMNKGKEPDMDAFGKELGPEMTKQIIDYYRSLAAKK